MGKYDSGFKYCTKCQIFVMTDETRCRRCGTILRFRARRNKIVKYIDPEKYGVVCD